MKPLRLGNLLPFSWQALPYVLLAATVFGALALVFAQQYLLLPPAYPDFLVGAITWDAVPKFQDLASYPLFVGGFLIGGFAAARLLGSVAIRGGLECERELITALTWWMVPVAIGVGGLIGNSNWVLPVVSAGLFGATANAVAVRLQLPRADMAPGLIGLGVLGALLLGLSPFAIATFQDRLPVLGAFPRLDSAPRFGGSITMSATVYLFYLCRRGGAGLNRYVGRLLAIGQVFLSLFYLLILPDLYIAGTKTLAIQATPWLWVLSSVLVLASGFDVVIRQRKYAHGLVGLAQLLSPLALFATIILFRMASTVIPHVPADDYHFGESLLGWWSLREFAMVPYVDFFPPHGIFADDVGGFLSLIFYDGTAATMAEADRLAAVLVMLLAFFAIRKTGESIGLAYISVFLFGLIARKLMFLFLVPFLCYWLPQPSNLKTKIEYWLPAWLLSAMILVLAVPAQGLIAVISFLPAIASRGYFTLAFDWKRLLGALALLGVLLAVAGPFLAMLGGAVRYVLDNGPINQIAYGLPWFWSWSGAAQDKTKALMVLGLDIFRMSWVWVPLIAAGLVLTLSRRREYRVYLIGVALPIFLFASLMSPYSMGRIDPAAISRPGMLSNFAVAILLPILLVPILAARGRAVLAVVVAFVCAGLGLANPTDEGLRSVLVKNEVGNLWEGVKHGMRNIGIGLVDPQHVDRLGRINTFLSGRLAPRETYLDVTGRNAHYFYFDRPPPLPITAPYNLAPIEQQRRAIAELVKNPPRLALLQAENINQDGGGPALRTHLLYRFVLQHYDAELHDGYVYGILKQGRDQKASISFTIRDLTDNNWERGIHRTESAIIVNDAKTVRFLHVGDEVVLPDGQQRRIDRVWVEGNAVWLDGARLMPAMVYGLRPLQIVTGEARRLELSAALMDDVFAVRDLRKVPVAWGQSGESLNARMNAILNLDTPSAAVHDLVFASTGTFAVTGGDPFFFFDLSGKHLAGGGAGLLDFEFDCEGATEARLQIFWWGDKMLGAAEAQSMRFSATNGRVIVPLDAYPGWLELKDISGLRIDLDSPASCRSISVVNIALRQRNNL